MYDVQTTNKLYRPEVKKKEEEEEEKNKQTERNTDTHTHTYTHFQHSCLHILKLNLLFAKSQAKFSYIKYSELCTQYSHDIRTRKNMTDLACVSLTTIVNRKIEMNKRNRILQIYISMHCTLYTVLHMVLATSFSFNLNCREFNCCPEL